ncbi:MAG: FAS1-like dehydratase domain-containing protein [Streptosporangiaceae bacterium]
MPEVIERSETLLPGPAEALGGLLGVPVPDLVNGEALPLLWHWMYLLDRPRQADLGPDGHPVRGTIPVPPGPGYRRMWAGGCVRMHGPLRCGDPAAKRSRVLSTQHKQGRSGPLTFVVVEHQVLQHGQLVIDEQQDIVYRQAGPPPGRPENPPGATPVIPAAEDEWAIDTSPTVLFRFSALTYNGHRIHYDRDYARDVEGYPGLLTHGPLQALAMAEAARARGYGARPSFEYRLTSPLFDFQGLVVKAAPASGSITTATRDLHGRQTASGTLQLTA